MGHGPLMPVSLTKLYYKMNKIEIIGNRVDYRVSPSFLNSYLSVGWQAYRGDQKPSRLCPKLTLNMSPITAMINKINKIKIQKTCLPAYIVWKMRKNAKIVIFTCLENILPDGVGTWKLAWIIFMPTRPHKKNFRPNGQVVAEI